MPVNEAELLAAVSSLPLLRKAKPAQKVEVFCKKLKFCCIVCDFKNDKVEIRLKQTKRQILTELIDFVDVTRGVLTDTSYNLSTQMFAINIFRPIYQKEMTIDFMEEENLSDRKEWVHLQLVYSYFIKMLDCSEFQANKAKKFFTHEFITRLIQMFAVEDVQEREYLKTILHRIYAKFLGMRAFTRKQISDKILEVAFENMSVPGLCEILEVMGSIINGYMRPYKAEHVTFLQQVKAALKEAND